MDFTKDLKDNIRIGIYYTGKDIYTNVYFVESSPKKVEDKKTEKQKQEQKQAADKTETEQGFSLIKPILSLSTINPSKNNNTQLANVTVQLLKVLAKYCKSDSSNEKYTTLAYNTTNVSLNDLRELNSILIGSAQEFESLTEIDQKTKKKLIKTQLEKNLRNFTQNIGKQTKVATDTDLIQNITKAYIDLLNTWNSTLQSKPRDFKTFIEKINEIIKLSSAFVKSQIITQGGEEKGSSDSGSSGSGSSGSSGSSSSNNSTTETGTTSNLGSTSAGPNANANAAITGTSKATGTSGNAPSSASSSQGTDLVPLIDTSNKIKSVLLDQTQN